MKIIRMGLRPWESPRRLQKPVEMALRTLIVVTTAAWICAARAWTTELSQPVSSAKSTSVCPSLSARHAIAL